MPWRGKNVFIICLFPFGGCRSGWYLLGLEGKKLLIKRLQYSVTMYALTLIELFIFWDAKGYENIAHLLILCRRIEDVWSAPGICTLQQQWRKKNPPDYQTAAQRYRQLLIWSRLLENCGMLWKWILQTSSFFFSFWLWKMRVSITSLPASPLCYGESGLA